MGRPAGYKGCVVEGCADMKHYSRGFCKYHYQQFYKGQRKEDGSIVAPFKEHGRQKKKDLVTKKIEVSQYEQEVLEFEKHTYSKYWVCPACNRSSSQYIMGFCPEHYIDYKKGYIDWDGKPTEIYYPKKVKSKYDIQPCRQ